MSPEQKQGNSEFEDLVPLHSGLRSGRFCRGSATLFSFSSNTLSMTAAAWLKPLPVVRSWAALTVLRTANSFFAPTSARHRVLLGGRHRLAHQIVGTAEGRVSRHARGVPTNDQSSGRAYLTLSRRDARDCAPGPRRATRRSAQYGTRRTIVLRTLFCLSSYVQRYGASAALSAAIMAS
jgi:hypothetical protein